MTERTTNEEREMLIADARDHALEPDEAADVSLLATLLADPSTWAEPSVGLEDSIVNAVVNDEPVAANVTAIGDRVRRTPRRRRIMVPIAAAAAAAVAILVGAMLTTAGSAGPAFTAELSPTALVPAAHASANVERNAGGFRVTLDASGLQPLQGQYYEAWLKDAAGTLVPIGTFSSSDHTITLWSGVSPATFSTLTVTIEAPDNNQASSGQVVLRGDVRPR